MANKKTIQVDVQYKICSICLQEIPFENLGKGKTPWTEGHNAQQINNGRCCRDCNETIVLPMRISNISKNRSPLAELWEYQISEARMLICFNTGLSLKQLRLIEIGT